MQDEQCIDEDNYVNPDVEGAEMLDFYNHLQQISRTVIAVHCRRHSRQGLLPHGHKLLQSFFPPDMYDI
jgi:hypothetical protein